MRNQQCAKSALRKWLTSAFQDAAIGAEHGCRAAGPTGDVGKAGWFSDAAPGAR